jgi:mannose-6-phosphate isomerase-like protein (cupin superfamily)
MLIGGKAMHVRRVVTGHDHTGGAIVVSDQGVEPVRPALLPGHELHQLWNCDEPPRFPNDGSLPERSTYFPPVGGFRFGLFTMPPETQTVAAPRDPRAARAALEADLPGLLDYNERGGEGMHTTPTIDFEVVLEGEITLELDGGATVVLHRGDTVVQNGTRHRWRNTGEGPATYAVCLVGAHHEDVEYRAVGHREASDSISQLRGD